jgi:predicted alpha-1,2-mannosidase
MTDAMKSPACRIQHLSRIATLSVCLAALTGWTAQPVDDALPLVGTGGHGHTYPGATVPFGFVQVSPDTRTEGWDACSGYHYTDKTILGFSHTHLSGTGCADLGDLLLLPMVGKLDGSLDAKAYSSPFTHEFELARPGYYRVHLDKYGVDAELTATAHGAMHRYSFNNAFAGTGPHLLLDLAHGLSSKALEASLKIESPTRVSGYRRSGGWANGKTVYFVIESSQPFTGYGLETDGRRLEFQSDHRTQTKGKNVRGYLDYANLPATGSHLVLRVGLSPVSVEGAARNLQAELGAKSFEQVHEAARLAWNDYLSRITIESTDHNLRETFYSAFYHTATAPTLYNDADGTYLGVDRQVHAPSGFNNYSTFSLWDTYRAEHPLMTLVQPGRVNDFVQSMLAFYQQSEHHGLPMWPLASCETGCMIGYHSVPVITDAYAKGFRGFDAELAFQAMKQTATNARNRQDLYQKYGYVPAETGKRTEATSRTLEFTFDDWCIAQMAKALGKSEDAAFFAQRAQNYTNVFDSATGFFRGKQADVTWRGPFNPKAVSFDDYTEANAWQYTFGIQHDVPGMMALYGGPKAFVAKLDGLFNEDSAVANYLIDVSGLMGQYAHGNEPCHHVAYLYALAGAQSKTAYRVRQILFTQYANAPDGLCGNDDCGQISAWYVWSALGLYPVNPASGVYVIGSPLFEKATLHLDPVHYKECQGGQFTIIAHNASRQNGYIKSAKLNGQPLAHPWVTHEEIARGGTLEFEMDIQPNLKLWAEQ